MLSLSIFTIFANVPVIDVSSLRRGFESDAARRCIAEIGLLRKVRKVFPHLASRDAIDAAMREWDRSKS